jgi:TRAP-type C4-dicarboxylate transport system substrate-binding protein
MTLFLAGALGGMTELAENLQNGVTDMAIFNPAFTPGLIPACELMAVPLTTPNTHVMSLIGWHLISEGYISLDGVKLLEIGGFENQVLCTTDRKVASLEDFGGLVLGTPGTYGGLLTQLNASEMMLPPPDIYSSVERGVVDGGIFGWALPYTYQMESILSYINTDSLGCDPWIIGINQDFWDSLPAEIQVIMLDLCREANSKFSSFVYSQNQIDSDYFDAQPGVELYTFNPGVYEELRELAQPLAEELAAQLDAQGFPGTEALEIITSDMQAFGY